MAKKFLGRNKKRAGKRAPKRWQSVVVVVDGRRRWLVHAAGRKDNSAALDWAAALWLEGGRPITAAIRDVESDSLARLVFPHANRAVLFPAVPERVESASWLKKNIQVDIWNILKAKSMFLTVFRWQTRRNVSDWSFQDEQKALVIRPSRYSELDLLIKMACLANKMERNCSGYLKKQPIWLAVEFECVSHRLFFFVGETKGRPTCKTLRPPRRVLQ